MPYKISRESGELPYQPNLGKNCTDFSSLQEIDEFLTRLVRLSVSATSNMLLRILKGVKGVAMATKFRQK